MKLRLIEKLEKIRSDSGCREFIIADAKDADMAWGIDSPGFVHGPAASDRHVRRTMEQFRQDIRDIVHQGEIDILLASVSTMSRLAFEEHLFDQSQVTPAIRANDTTDIWCVRHAAYRNEPSRPFATCTLEEAQFGGRPVDNKAKPLINLGLYSMTFNNQVDADMASLTAFREFRRKASECGFRYFLEVFAPNVNCGIAPENIPEFINDSIVRSLAGIARSNWPEFLKIPYFGPRYLEELVSYDRSLVVGILGGSSGTTHDAFKLIADARRHGARVALYGRKIKDAEHQLTFISMLRAIVAGNISPAEAVRAYHGELQKLNIAPRRTLTQDMELTDATLSYSR